MKHKTILPTFLLGAVCAVTANGCKGDDSLQSGDQNVVCAPGEKCDTVADGERYIVSYSGEAGKAAILQAGGTIVRDLPNQGLASVVLPASTRTNLRQQDGIGFIEPDVKRYPLAIPESEGFPSNSVEVEPYGISMVQADLLSDAQAGNRTLCIIDSGIDAEHLDHAENQLSGTNDPGTGNWYTDENSHGTHVAGTVLGMANGGGVVGVNPGGNLNVHIIKVFSANGWAYSSTLIAAVEACEAAGANVISMSLGGPSRSESEAQAFAAAHSRGVLSIAAAGNSGNTSYSYPASYDAVVSVAAIDQSGELAPFSQRTDQVELSAPGVAVLSSVPTDSGQRSDLDVEGYVASIGMAGSPLATGSGPLVDCGTGESTCAGAEGAVCLIQRGNIKFSDKVLACQNGGGVAAVIYNNAEGPLNGTLGDVVTTIPSVGITMADGEILKGRLGENATLTVGRTSWAFFSGTSMATPHVSAVAALIWSFNPEWSNDDIRNALAQTAVDLGESGRDNSYGHGLIQAKAALDYLQGGVCVPECPEPQCGEPNGCGGICNADINSCGVCGNPACPTGGNLRIEQVFYDIPGLDAVGEAVWISNQSDEAASTAGYSLADNVQTWELPAAVVGAGETIVLARDTAGFERLFGSAPDIDMMPLELGNSGDELTLVGPDGEMVDYVAWERTDWPLKATTNKMLHRIAPEIAPSSWEVIKRR